MNKNISVWRGESTPPTNNHLWVKSDNCIYLYDGSEWVLISDQSTVTELRNLIEDNSENIKKINNTTTTLKLNIKQIKDSLESIEEEITWNSKFNINDYTKSGVYVITGNRQDNKKDNLPILNVGENASFSAKLFVTESPEGTTTYRSIIGQTLFLSNAEGHETKIYTRSANKTSYDGGVTYEITWGDWQVCQGMKEVGIVDSYDSFIDNGLYSGIYKKNSIVETFVIVTINDYAVKNQLGAPKSVSQLKYALNANTNKSELSVRVGGGQTFKWEEWKPVFDEENITTQITNIQNQLNTLTEDTTDNINDILTSINDLQNLKVIDLGSNRKPDQAINNIIAHVRDNNIKHAILFKYIAPDGSSSLGICISRIDNYGWTIYLLARKGIERLQFNSSGVREDWNEYGGILRHQQNTIGDGRLETMSINGLKSLIVDNLNANEDANNRKLLSILSANQGRILNEKINTKHPILIPGTNIKNINGQSILGEGNIEIEVIDNLQSTSTTSALSANMGTMLAQEIIRQETKINSKQPLLTGDEFRTINGQSIMGEGDIVIEAGITEKEKAEINAKIEGKAFSESVSELQEEIDAKAPKVGYAPDLKVNFAKELVGRGEATPEVIGGIRPTGEISIGDGNATITKIKGESVVWNQLVDGAITFVRMSTQDNITYVPTMTTESGNLYYTLGVAKGSHKYLCTGSIVNSRGTGPVAGSVPLNTVFSFADGKNIYLVPISGDVTVSPEDWARIEEPIQFHDLTLMFGSGNEPTTIEDFEARKPLGVSNEYNEGTIVSYDGSALKSVGFNAWDEEWENGGISGDGNNWNDDRTVTAIRTTELVPVAPNQAYEISYPSRVTTLQGVMYDKDGKAITGSVFYTKEITTLPECRYIRVSWFDYLTSTIKGYQHDICIHLKHTYTPERYPNGYAPYEADTHLLPDVKSILDADGNQLFPYGLLSAGSVHDEITATKAIKRVGVVDMGTFDWRTDASFNCWVIEMPNDYKHGTLSVGNCVNKKYPVEKYSIFANSSTDKVLSGNNNAALFVRDSSYTSSADFKQAMSGVLLYYELAEPIEVDLPEPLNMTYEAWDFGTEELVYDTPTTPLNADIVYQFNAVDRIRENSSAIDALKGHVEERKDDGIKLLDNGNLELTLKGETREFMPATPSGDPMHYAYVSAGAEYNATNNYILKDAPWKDMVDTIEDKATWGLDVVDASMVKQMTIGGVVYNYATENRTSPEGGTYLRYYIVGKGSNGVWVEDETKVLHLPKCWYLNGLGDITGAEMMRIVENKFIASVWDKSRAIQGIKARTLLNPYTLSYTDGIGTISNLYHVKIESFTLKNDYFKIVPQEYCIPTSSLVGNQGNLKYIACTRNLTSITHNNVRVLPINRLSASVNISSPVISKGSVQQSILNAIPTSAITITLHADAYARLVDDADIVAALKAKNTALEGRGGSISLVSA